MRVIIAGGRDFTDFDYIKGYMATLPPWVEITEVVSGGATGVDTLAIAWASMYNKPYRVFHAEWDRLGRRAGPIRNAEMAVYADGLIAFWNGESKGTKNMIDQMAAKGAWVYVVRTDIPWCKQFNDGIPILNNVHVWNPNARTA
jgi:hypothetical protein